MTSVTVTGIGAMTAVELKNSLLDAGLQQPQDFWWEYRPVDWQGLDPVTLSRAVFYFQDPAMATFYQLRWSHR
jgi:hypothetical protein